MEEGDERDFRWPYVLSIFVIVVTALWQPNPHIPWTAFAIIGITWLVLYIAKLCLRRN
jgi:hypothetical protein